MSLWVDRRGQSVVIGSLLIFTFLILAFSGYQTFIVPSQNQQVEAEHFQETEKQFSTLRSNIVNSVDSEETRSTAIELGTEYPVRRIALNPPPAAGRLTTTDPGDVNITSTDTTGNVCRADGGTPTTRSLVYTPGYNEYGAPEALGYENRVTSGEFRSGRVDEQRLVRESASGNDRISLFLLNGSVDEYGVNTYSLEVNASRQNTTTLNNPTIIIPSRFDNTTWNDEILADRSNVTVTPATTGNRVELNFTGGDYDVSCAVVGLDSDPAFTPPDDSGGGGPSDNDSGGAYDVQWLDPSNGSQTSPCSADDCTLDASQSETLNLTATTEPNVQGANIDFAVSDSDTATIDPLSNNTGPDGNASTGMQAQSDGMVKVYASGKDSRNVINFTIENFIGDPVVYTRSGKKISTVNESKDATDIQENGKTIGPLIADIDGDGDKDIPYVEPSDNGAKVYIADPNESDAKAQPISSISANDEDSLLGVGKWNGANTSVYFANTEDNGAIYRTNSSGGEDKVVKPKQDGASAVAGPADIDGDGDNELVFASNSPNLKYFEPEAIPGNTTAKTIPVEEDIGTSGGIGLGRPADFNGNDTARIPVVDGESRLLLVDNTGSETVLVDSDGKDIQAAKSPVATVDWDGDGELEIVYIDPDGKLKYVDNVTESDQTVKNTGIDEPRKQTGVA